MQDAGGHCRSWLQVAGFCLVFAATLLAEGRHALGEACSDDIGAKRSPVEQAAWRSFVAGEAFDMAEAKGPLHRSAALTGGFLREVLSCTDAARIPGRAIVIRNAFIIGKIDLSHRTISLRLECDDCLLHDIAAGESEWTESVTFRRSVVQGAVDLSHAHLHSSLRFSATRINGALNLSSGRIDGGLQAFDGFSVEAILGDSAKIGRSLELDGVEVGNHADFWGIEVADDFIIASAEDGRASIIGSKVPVGQLASAGEELPDVLILQSAQIGRRISIGATQINGGVDMDAVRISEDLWLRDCSLVAGPINLVFARIGQNVDFSTTVLRRSDLTGARVGGELRLGAPDGRHTSPFWAPDGRLILRNTEVSSWTDATSNPTPRSPNCVPIGTQPDPWPGQIDIIGFSYRDVEGLGGSSTTPRNADWFCQWLARQAPYSLEPYQHAAAYLRQVGLSSSADDVLYCGKVLQIANTPSWLGKIALQVQRVFVGFGYKVERSAYWALLFIILGQQIFRRTPEAKKHKMPIGLIYSIDMFVPPLSLRRIHHEIDLAGWQRYYFYFHKFMGWVLGSFVLATLLGVLGGSH